MPTSTLLSEFNQLSWYSAHTRKLWLPVCKQKRQNLIFCSLFTDYSYQQLGLVDNPDQPDYDDQLLTPPSKVAVLKMFIEIGFSDVIL